MVAHTDATTPTLTLDELESALSRIGHDLDAATAAYHRESTADAITAMQDRFAIAERIARACITSSDVDTWTHERQQYNADAEPCPICEGTGWVEDEEGFFTECDHGDPWDDGSPLF